MDLPPVSANGKPVNHASHRSGTGSPNSRNRTSRSRNLDLTRSAPVGGPSRGFGKSRRNDSSRFPRTPVDVRQARLAQLACVVRQKNRWPAAVSPRAAQRELDRAVATRALVLNQPADKRRLRTPRSKHCLPRLSSCAHLRASSLRAPPEYDLPSPAHQRDRASCTPQE